MKILLIATLSVFFAESAYSLSIETKLTPVVVMVLDVETQKPIQDVIVKNTDQSIKEWGQNEADPEKRISNDGARKERLTNDLGVVVLFCSCQPKVGADKKYEVRITATFECSAKGYDVKIAKLDTPPPANELVGVSCSPVVMIYVSKSKTK